MLKLENSLALQQTTLSIVRKVVVEIKQLEQTKKFDSELTKSVCQLVHNLVKESYKGDNKTLSKDQSKQIDKKQVVRLVLKEVFSLTGEEMSVIDQQIDFILENNLLKKDGMVRKASSFFLKTYKSLSGSA